MRLEWGWNGHINCFFGFRIHFESRIADGCTPQNRIFNTKHHRPETKHANAFYVNETQATRLVRLQSDNENNHMCDEMGDVSVLLAQVFFIPASHLSLHVCMDGGSRIMLILFYACVRLFSAVQVYYRRAPQQGVEPQRIQLATQVEPHVATCEGWLAVGAYESEEEEEEEDLELESCERCHPKRPG